MNGRKFAERIEHVFHYCLLGIFLFSSVAFLFMVVINWEDWFFGMKMDGIPAGILLLTKFLITGSFAYLLIRYPERITGITALSVIFYGFLCLDSAVTVRTLSGGQEFFSSVPVVLVLVPAGFLIVQVILKRGGKREEDPIPGNQAAGPVLTMTAPEKPDRYTPGNFLIVLLAMLVAVIFIGPVVPHLIFFTHIHPGTGAGLTGDSLLSKVSANGTTEWQTRITGYSDYPLVVCPATDGGFIVAGMFRLSGYADPVLRVMKLDQNGIPSWDFQRGVSAYPETNLGALQTVLPDAEEYTVIMADGFVIRLDAGGNEIWHRDYPDTVVQTSISRPDGGFMLLGDAHEGRPSDPGWRKFDGWILSADRKGNVLWEKKETGFSNCMRALQTPDENVLVSCSVPGSDPDTAENQLVALDTQGNYLWKKNFTEKNDGIIYSITSRDNGTYELLLRGEGERRYTLDRMGNTLKEELLPAGPDSFSHETVPDVVFNVTTLAGNRMRVNVRVTAGTEKSFSIGYPADGENVSGIYSVNPTADGGFLVSGTAK